MTSDPIRSPTDRRRKTSLPICLQPASPQHVRKSRVPGQDWHANGIKRETAVGQRASDVTLPVFLQLVVRRSERTSRQHGVCQRWNTVNTLQINFKSHDVRAWVSCNEKPEVRTVLIPFWERLKQDVWTAWILLHLSFSYPSASRWLWGCWMLFSLFFLNRIIWKKKK